tara:strand:+ start:6354 stop:6926 length:573 start_codon:yes stop_codon:yes gene_type:complete
MGGFSLLSREQEKKKLFLELGNRFNLPKELIIYLYQVLMNSIKHDRDLQINFHKNILSSHFCGPSSTQDIDEPLTLNNPFQHRYPLGKGNEWFIKMGVKHSQNINYNGFYNQLKPRDILCQQIKIYGDHQFLLKPRSQQSQGHQSLEGFERLHFINKYNTDLFDNYWEYLEVDGYNLICNGDSFQEEWLE